MWTYNGAAIELAAAVFIELYDYHSIAMSFEKLNSWRSKRYKIRLHSFLYLSWFTATKNTSVRYSSLFSTDLERYQFELDPVNAMFFLWMPLFVFERCFWKIAECIFPFYSWTAYSELVYQWYLVMFLSTALWFGTIEQFCTINVCFPKIKTTASNC